MKTVIEIVFIIVLCIKFIFSAASLGRAAYDQDIDKFTDEAKDFLTIIALMLIGCAIFQ